LLDARILSDVYLALTGGQTALALDAISQERRVERQPRARAECGRLKVVYADERELDAHVERLSQIDAVGGDVPWDAWK